MSTFRKGTHSTDTLVGIDFGTTKICVVIGKVKPEGGIEVIGLGKQQSLGVRRGVVVNIPMTVDALRKAVDAACQMARCDVGPAFAGIAGAHIKSLNSSGVVAIHNEEVIDNDVERAIEAAKAVAIPLDREVLHVIPQEFLINDQDGVRDPVGMAGVRLEARVHIVTGAATSARNIYRCGERAGLQISDVILEPLASAEAVLTQDEKELGVVLVDIGGGTTDVAIFSRGSVVHTGILGMGGNHITNDIAVGLRTSVQDAEQIKIASGCAMGSMLNADELLEVPTLGIQKTKQVSRSILAKIIEPRIEEIFQLVAQEIKNSGFRHLCATGVVLTGGGCLLEGSVELAEFILEMPVRRGVPQGVEGLQDVINSPTYATAVGLLLYGVKHPKARIPEAVLPTPSAKILGRMKAWLSEVF